MTLARKKVQRGEEDSSNKGEKRNSNVTAQYVKKNNSKTNRSKGSSSGGGGGGRHTAVHSNLLLFFAVGIALSSVVLTPWGREASIFWRSAIEEVRWRIINNYSDGGLKVLNIETEQDHGQDKTLSDDDSISPKHTSQQEKQQQQQQQEQHGHQMKLTLKSTWRQHKGTFEVVDKIKHNPKSFTQGLSYFDGTLYESTGNYKESKVIRLHPYTGEELESISMDDKYFGEGMAHYIDKDDGKLKLIQLTYKEQTGFIYDVHDKLRVVKTFSYDNMLQTGEGWGITHDPVSNTFLVTDGSSWVYVWDDSTLKEIRRMEVTLSPRVSSGDEEQQARKISYVNELEVDPFDNYQTFLANIWYNDVIVRIHVDTGNIVSVYDFSTLWPFDERPARTSNAEDKKPSWDCFNGIAATDVPDEYYVTGKWWPHMYRVRLK